MTELWLCCLKLLVNLTHDGPTAAALLMADAGDRPPLILEIYIDPTLHYITLQNI